MSLADVLSGLRADEPGVRQAALVRLARSKDARAIPYLRRAAEEEPVAELRYLARKGIQFIEEATGTRPAPRPASPPAAARVGGPAAPEVGPGAGSGPGPGPQLVAALVPRLADPDPRARLQAAREAANSGQVDLVAPLRAALAKEAEGFVAATLLDALRQLADPGILEVARPWLAHADPRVRANAIEAVASSPEETALHYLVPHLRDPDNRCRGNAVLALKRFGRVNVFSTLETMLASDSASMQDSATFCLGRMGQGPEVYRLLMLAMQSPFVVTRNQARSVLRILAGRGGERAGEILRRFGEADEAAAVEDLFRKAAVRPEAAPERWESPEEEAARIRRGLAELSTATQESHEDLRRTRADVLRASLEAAQRGDLRVSDADPARERSERLVAGLAALSGLGHAPGAGAGSGSRHQDRARDVAERLAGLRAGGDPDDAGADPRADRSARLFAALSDLKTA